MPFEFKEAADEVDAVMEGTTLASDAHENEKCDYKGGHNNGHMHNGVCVEGPAPAAHH